MTDKKKMKFLWMQITESDRVTQNLHKRHFSVYYVIKMSISSTTE